MPNTPLYMQYDGSMRWFLVSLRKYSRGTNNETEGEVWKFLMTQGVTSTISYTFSPT